MAGRSVCSRALLCVCWLHAGCHALCGATSGCVVQPAGMALVSTWLARPNNGFSGVNMAGRAHQWLLRTSLAPCQDQLEELSLVSFKVLR